MNELPSRTSIWAAAARAVGARSANPHWSNPDHLAGKLMGPRELALLGEHPLARALEQEKPDLRQNMEVLSAAMTLIVRTKFIDERLERAIGEGASQVVIMGAGWDTRAYRFAGLLGNARVFEIDRPNTQEWKRRRAEEALGPAPENLRYLPIDFRTQSLAEVLGAGGYDPAAKTLFLWEGVTMYLPEEAVRSTLRWIATQATGSAIVFDFAHRALIELIEQTRNSEGPMNEMAKAGMDRIRQISSWGEPWIFGVPTDGSAAAFVEELGLEHRETLGMASTEAAQRYLGWTGDKPFPPAIRQMYSITKAAVR